MKRKMREPINPTREEIREWAFLHEPMEPEQDSGLHLAHLREFDLYVELAANDDCPSWGYFLRLLYFVVGDAIRTEYRTTSENDIHKILSLTEKHPKHRFHLFRQRAVALIANPQTFSYDEWCAGMLASLNLKELES